ncbi:MAG: sigma 54-interacting transcriptional regulator [candidate division Zixibacteria bacterium]|nr:sigma 54-interacting transcriptional regulator [candidate division Zixibacteria bacterium]
MRHTSQNLHLDNRLLAVEELYRQRKAPEARIELERLSDSDFAQSEHELGLFLSLKADSYCFEGEYRKSLEAGIRGAKLLADSPLTRRYGRALLILAKAYFGLGDLKNSEIRARDALASFRRDGDIEGQIDSLNAQARAVFTRCDYSAASLLLDDAALLCTDNPRQLAQLTGNSGRIKILSGNWSAAEKDLTAALEYGVAHNEETSQAVNLLSLGYLNLRRREFTSADRYWKRAQVIIDRLNLKREKIILLEYQGEMAIEKKDMFKAKSILSEAYHQGRLLAPESALVSQSARRLAEVELSLDNLDEAMKYAQKALELAQQMGEKIEAGLAKKVIAQVFASRSSYDEAMDYITRAVETVREAGDPFDLARTLLYYAEISGQSGSDEHEKIRSAYDEATRIFKKLKLDFWLAEADFRSGLFACSRGDLSRGFKKISRAEKLFTTLSDTGKVRAVNQFLTTMADQAVALSISQENSFKIFGNLVTQGDTKDLKSGKMDDVLNLLLRRAGADRGIVYSPDFTESPVVASFPITPQQIKKFDDTFRQLLGQEVSLVKPTLLLDCRRDPYINNLFPEVPYPVASVIVVPFKMSDNSNSFLYLDKLSPDNTINPFGQDELNFAVGFSDIIAFKAAELHKIKLIEDNRRLKAQLRQEAAFANIITQSSQMLDLLNQVRQIVDSPISIVIEGETGCGKDLLARAIHYNSNRRDKRFISINCAALPETLLESELFGYRRGSFTGADRDKPGLFEEAHGGTFFLDEIADMPLSIQAKILRALESKEIVRLGESTPRKVDVRILSATNKDLKEEMAAGRFRQDLFYRLSAFSFRLPSLRERKEDIPLLVNHMLLESGKTCTVEVTRHLMAYDWPGNVRELENEMKKLVLLAGDDEKIRVEILSARISQSTNNYASPSVLSGNAADVVEFSQDYSLYDFLSNHEKRFIIKALMESRGIKKHAANRLNIPESTLRLKIKEYNLNLKALDLPIA